MTFAEDPTPRVDDERDQDERRDGDEHHAEDEDHIGIFRSWRSLYVTVIVYTVALTIILYAITRLLDYSS